MKVHAIKTGSVRIKTAQMEAPRPGPLGVAGILLDTHWSGWLPTYAWAIEHEEGVIVVDTGQSTGLLREAKESLHPYVRWQAQFEIEPEEEIGPQLRGLGIGPRDVRRVVLTHLHMDHDAGLAHFPGSEIVAARGEIDKARGILGAIRGYLPHRWPDWFNPVGLDLDDGPHGPFAASKRLTRRGDVIAVATPGHTAHHISVLVEDSDVALLLAGDTSYSEALMLAGKVDGVSANAATARGTLAAIRQYGRSQPLVYLPTHDPESGQRLAARQASGPAAAELAA